MTKKAYDLYVKVLSFFNLTPADVVSVLKGAIIAGLGAAITYFVQWVTKHDFGVWGPIISAVWAVVVNTGRKSIDTPFEKATGVNI